MGRTVAVEGSELAQQSRASRDGQDRVPGDLQGLSDQDPPAKNTRMSP